MRIALVLGLALASPQALAAEANWTRTFVEWGQARTESQSRAQADARAKAAVDQLTADCNATEGRLATILRSGLCTTQSDPLFCATGCYDCPVTGAAACTHDKGVTLKAGDAVVTTLDVELWSGNTLVGRLPAGESFKVARIDREWASLTRPSGAAVTGWVRHVYLTPAPAQR